MIAGDIVRIIRGDWFIDEVTSICKGPKNNQKGKIIVCYGDGHQDTLVEFFINIEGHSGLGRGKAKHCWWVSKNDLIKITASNTNYND